MNKARSRSTSRGGIRRKPPNHTNSTSPFSTALRTMPSGTSTSSAKPGDGEAQVVDVVAAELFLFCHFPLSSKIDVWAR